MSETQLSDLTLAALGGKTRGRILTSSLLLFNQAGYERVTTAQLADAADVLEGTLWYHFRAKHDLLFAHLGVLETRLETQLETPIPSQPDGAVSHFMAIFSVLWEFRYLLRDPLEPLQRDDAGVQRLQQVYCRVEQIGEKRLRLAAARGLLDLEGVDVEALSVSAFLIGRYWLDFARIRYGNDGDFEHYRMQGVRQLISLVRPYLTDEAIDLFNRIEMTSLLMPSQSD